MASTPNDTTSQDLTFVAYIGTQADQRSRLWPVTSWEGEPIGTARVVSSWPVRSYIGSRMYAIRATINTGTFCYKEFHGRTFGPGMSVVLHPAK